uniref:Uncharacterized protein n=1 Tax=Oryza sativa subsp. japonica TaxID=39947 RepID=Q5Z559_ORYSJ|nr:hypothetical protein [Oryza sativa Japonica Group]
MVSSTARLTSIEWSGGGVHTQENAKRHRGETGGATVEKAGRRGGGEGWPARRGRALERAGQRGRGRGS